jgi:hypothetical protein
MRRFLVLLCLTASLAFAQDVPRAEMFVGYSFASIDTNGLTTRQSVPTGINLSFVGNANQWIGAETNTAAYYKNISGIELYDYSLLFGPRVHYQWAFFHFLFGMDDLVGKSDGVKASQGSPVGAIGGGGTLKLSRYFSLEATADYILSHHNIVGGPGIDQNNFRASVGIVFTFGHAGVSAERSPAPAPQPVHIPTVPTEAAGMSIAALGMTVTLAQDRGAQITDITPNGAAALAGLHLGDVINAVDGQQIKTPMELSMALSGKTAGGKVHLGYMIRGQWQAETEIVLP